MFRGNIYREVYRFISAAIFALAVAGLSPGGFAADAKTAAKAPASKTAAKTAANPVATPAKTAAKVPAAPPGPKVLTAPPMIGLQNIVSPDKSKIASPDQGKAIASAKSFTEQLKELEKSKNNGKEKPVKMRAQVVDGKVCVWGRNPEDAEMSAGEAVRKYVGRRSKYQLKDSTFLSDSSRYICTLRFNYKDQMPENWYLESEMVTGFGKTKERAYFDAMTRAAARSKNVQGKAEWAKADSVSKNATDLGVIPYDYVFSSIGDTQYCKVYFRYFMPR